MSSLAFKKENQSQFTSPEFQKYQVIQVIGVGTFGKVYQVKHRSNNKCYAMKHVLQNKKYKNRELQIIQTVSSEYVVKLYEHFYSEEKEGHYLNLVMQYLPETLSKVIKSNYIDKIFIDNDTIKSYARCLLVALKDLNDLKICHRDIKPSNILINEEKQAKLCDFGSAKILTEQKNISYICSRYYRPPELILGATFYTNQVDIWSLGCVIAQMLMSRSLFEGANSTSLLMKIVKVLGNPTVEDVKGMNLDPDDVDILPMQGCGLKNVIKKVNSTASDQLVELIALMIVYHPQKRITAAQALKLPLFK